MDNKEEVKKQIEENISKFDKKEFSFYFFTMDTKGNPTAAVSTIYQHVKVLNEMGYKASILHEKNDYTSVGGWLGDEYAKLPHTSIESQELKVSPSDFVIVPELFSNVLEQTANLPCCKIIFCQSYDYILEMLAPGKSWTDYGVNTCITTTEKQKVYIDALFSNRINTKIIPVSIPDIFKPSEKPKKPIVGIFTRDQRDTVKIFKTFYLKYPHLKWISFRDLRGLPRETFAKSLSELAILIWIDDISGFGTMPLEAMKSNVPVLGKIPNMVPEWMEDKNGLWTHDINTIPDLTANYIQAWLEDSEPKELFGEMEKLKDKYSEESQTEKIKEVYESIIAERKDLFISKLPQEELVDNNTELNEQK
jgi:hypothetical protein